MKAMNKPMNENMRSREKHGIWTLSVTKINQTTSIRSVSAVKSLSKSPFFNLRVETNDTSAEPTQHFLIAIWGSGGSRRGWFWEGGVRHQLLCKPFFANRPGI